MYTHTHTYYIKMVSSKCFKILKITNSGFLQCLSRTSHELIRALRVANITCNACEEEVTTEHSLRLVAMGSPWQGLLCGLPRMSTLGAGYKGADKCS